MSVPNKARIAKALHVAWRFAGNDGAHHKAWTIDQMVRALNGCTLNADTQSFDTNDAYEAWVRLAKSGIDGPETYSWDEGIAP